MDPDTLALLVSSLGTGLVTVLAKLLEKGFADPFIEKGFEPLRELFTRGYDKRKDQAQLGTAVEAAIKRTTGSADPNQWGHYRWTLALDSVQANPDLATRTAAAALEMTNDNPARLPADLVKDLRLAEDQQPAFASFLFNLRSELTNLNGYGAGIEYADHLHMSGILDGMYELVAGVVGDRDGEKNVRVQIIPPDTRHLEKPYLDFLMNELRQPAMEGRSKDKQAGEPVRLERVYIALNTTAVRSEPMYYEWGPRRRTLSALRGIMESRRVVLLGDPGSGKSTFAQHLSLCLAGARLGPAEQWLSELKADDLKRWQLKTIYFPIFVHLRRFAADFESLPEDDEEGQAKHLLAFINKELTENGFGDLINQTRQLLESGDALVIFDGLDEAVHPRRRDDAQASADRRTKVAQAIAQFAHSRFPRAKVIVTCRVQQYPDNAAWVLPRVPAHTLADFTWDQVGQFIDHWFDELHSRGREADPEGQRDSLIAALGSNDKLRELAYKPILLTQMAYVHAVKRLPDSRVEVYKECAALLLWEWETLRARQSKRKESAEEFLTRLGTAALTPEVARQALDAAVFDAHSDGDPEIPGEKLRHRLRDTLSACGNATQAAKDAAQQFLDGWLNGRSGLLIPAGEDSFGVPHRSFREFMAARHLSKNDVVNPETGEEEDWEESGPRLAQTDPVKWGEVFRFAAALNAERHKELARALDSLHPESASGDLAAVPWLLLTAEIVAEIGPTVLRLPSNRLGQQVYARLERNLIRLMRDTAGGEYPGDTPRHTSPDDLSPKTRLEAGLLLDSLGWTPTDLYDFVELPHPTPSARGGGATGEGHFHIAKYPVTVLQYRRFLDARDYVDPEIWKSVTGFDESEQPQARSVGDEAWAWFQEANKEGKREPRLWEDPRFGAARRLLPVVGVSWYEAAAYCVWLQRHRADPSVPEGRSVPEHATFRLPAETEWTAAAGGQQHDRYPWDSPSPDDDSAVVGKGGRGVRREDVITHANTGESDLGGTTPVCMYPAGASAAGAMDMSGNVWEWQANLYTKGETGRTQRGGTWFDGPVSARVASGAFSPAFHGHYLEGFRVVALAPGSRF